MPLVQLPVKAGWFGGGHMESLDVNVPTDTILVVFGVYELYYERNGTV